MVVFRSLRSRLLIPLAAIFVVVVAALTYAAIERRESDTQYILGSFLAQGKFLAEQQRNTVLRAESFLQFMASSREAATLATDPDCNTKLRTYARNDNYLANVFIVDLRGNIICISADSPWSTNLADRGYFQRALASSGGGLRVMRSEVAIPATGYCPLHSGISAPGKLRG